MGSVVGKGSMPGKKISPEDLKWFQHHTSHSTKAIEEMHTKFYKDYPRGGIYRHEFAKLLPAGMGTVHFLDHIFRTLDLDGNGYLDFKENMLAMDLVNAKTPVDKLKWAFRIYDSDKSGAIDKKEMTRVMKSIYAMLGTKGTDRSSLDEKATAHAARLFKHVDVDGDGELNEKEFLEGCQKDSELMEKLEAIVSQCMINTAT